MVKRRVKSAGDEVLASSLLDRDAAEQITEEDLLARYATEITGKAWTRRSALKRDFGAE